MTQDKDATSKAVSLLKGFIEFVEVPEVQAVIDGAFDPDLLMAHARRFVAEHDQASEVAMEKV